MIVTVTANAAIDKRYVVENNLTGQVNRVKSCVATAGGKGLNVSRVAVLAGAEVIATGFLGGYSGKFIHEKIQDQGIISDFVWCEGESRSCINIWDENARTQTEFLEPGFTVREQDVEQMIEKFKALLCKADMITISGSVPKGTDQTLYIKMLEEAAKAGKKVILDTSGKLLEQCVEARPYMIKPNMDEIRMLTGKKLENRDELLDAAEMLHKKGIEIVVISRGKEGSIISCKEGVFEAKVPKIDAVNTVGCGDSMIAGFAIGLEKNLPIEETIRLASAISAANALRMETGYFLKEDLEDLLPQISISKIK